MSVEEQQLLRKIPSVDVLLQTAEARWPPAEVPRRMRLHTVPVFTRVQRGRVLVDPRTLPQGDEEILLAAFRAVLYEGG